MSETPTPGSEHNEQITDKPKALEAALSAEETVPSESSPEKPKKTGERLLRKMKSLDGLLLLLLVALVAVVSVFPVRNSDIFLHLASGRLVDQGNFTFEKDPFVASEQGWVNHSWLFDWGLYKIYTLSDSGMDVMLVIKALFILATVLLIVKAGHVEGQRLWLPIFVGMIATLALSARILVQPLFLSYFFLALTIWLLTRMTGNADPTPEGEGGEPAPIATPWALVPIFALWANCDQWFFLGPVLVGLWLLGTALQQSIGPVEAGSNRVLPKLGIVFVASTAATLLNPNIAGVWQLPVQLGFSASAEEVKSIPAFHSLFFTPFESIYFSKFVGRSAAGIAYFPLIFLGLLSFGLESSRVRWSRLFSWIAFLALSVIHARAIPFFAIVGGAITARNFLDFVRHKLPTGGDIKGQYRGWLVSGRVFTGLLMFVLVLASIPGWTQAQPYYARAFGLGFETDPALARTTKKLAEIADWHKKQFPDTPMRVFNISPETGHYAAWYHPEGRSFVDRRINIPARTAQAYRDVYQSLSTDPLTTKLEEPRWRSIFRDWKIQYLVYYKRDIFIRVPLLERLLANPQEWVPLYEDGSNVIFAWIDPETKSDSTPFEEIAWNPVQLAFGDKPMTAPATRPAHDPVAREWWKEVLVPNAHQPWESQQARLYTLQYYAQVLPWKSRLTPEWQSVVVSRFAMGVTPCSSLAEGVGTMFRTAISSRLMPRQLSARNALEEFFLSYTYEWHSHHLIGADDAEFVANLYLAVRSGRKALHSNIYDARSHLVLGQAYHALATQTRESFTNTQSLAFRRLRRYQTIAALQQALRLDLDHEHGHRLLTELYLQMGYLDLALSHFLEQFRLAKEGGLQPGETSEQFGKRLQEMQNQLKQLQAEVKRRQDRFLVQSASLDPLSKAVQAMDQQVGLAESAFEILSQLEHSELFKGRDGTRTPVGAQLLIRLHLIKGELVPLRGLFATLENNKKVDWVMELGMSRELLWPNYHWFRLALAAASGDYARADSILEIMFDGIEGINRREELDQRIEEAALVAVELTSRGFHANPWINLGNWFAYETHFDYFNTAVPALYQRFEDRARILAIRAWLALEAGQNQKARDFLVRFHSERWPARRFLPGFLPVGNSRLLPAILALGAGLEELRGPILIQLDAIPSAVLSEELLDAGAK